MEGKSKHIEKARKKGAFFEKNEKKEGILVK